MAAHIYLYRHAAVDFDNTLRIPMSAFRRATDLYNTAPIAAFEPPQPVPNCDYVVTSNLRRSPDTAMNIFGFVDVSDPLFREAELPDLPAWALTARPTTYFAIARVLWMLGRKRNCESRTDFHKRVEAAAALLIRAANDHAAVAFIGHGWFNRALAKSLQTKGFAPTQPPQHAHGTFTLFTG